MPLYSSFNPEDYYDEKPKKVETGSTNKHPVVQSVPTNIKKSLYDQAKEIATSVSKYTGPDFRDIYRVGQLVAIQGPNGAIRTKKGQIAEIVERNLMYVWMLDTYKDAQDQWLVDFVTDKDTIHKL